MISISVHICTFNPREEHLRRTINALKTQTLARDKWEFLLVNNASTTEVAQKADLTWHPNARYLVETKIGKTNALIHAIRSAQAELLVTVDDDNVLAPNYLERCLEIASQFPMLGAWGGQIIPEFETQPPQWVIPHLHNLALYESDHDVWTNLPRAEYFPPGAGMCFRALVGRHYSALVAKDPMRAGLDRRGEIMIGCGDTDLACCSVDLGFGTGRFTALKLTHLIPKERITPAAILDLIERTAYSFTIFHHIRPETLPAEPLYPTSYLKKRNYNKLEKLQNALMPKEIRRVREAALRGLQKASIELRKREIPKK